MSREENRIAIVTVSDRCSQGSEEDKSGPFLCNHLREKGHEIVDSSCVPDDYLTIQKKLIDLSDSNKVDIVITSGGTGFTERDVTPEATSSILEKKASGLVISMICQGIKSTSFAALSRPSAGIRNSTLIVNLPGSLKAVKENIQFIEPLFNHIVDQLRGDKLRVRVKHVEIQEPSLPLVFSLKDPNENMENCASSHGFPYRKSPYEMISVDEAIKKVVTELKSFCLFQSETISIKDCNTINRRIFQDEYSPIDVPPFPASIKDGYALLSSDGCASRKVMSPSITAGLTVNDIAIDTGWCIRINTGAPVPDGADSVVQVEDTEVLLALDGEEKEIAILKKPKVGQDIRKKGSDISKGDKILEKRTKVGPVELGLLASVGISSVKVFKKPRVAVLSTGDELKDADNPVGEGLIFDANRVTLISFLRQRGCEVLDLGIVRDEAKLVESKIGYGLERADILITTGGVSMGEKDIIKQILTSSFGCKIHFGRVNLKPGKPTAFASWTSSDKKKFVFALPGNPVSAFVTCYLFVGPVINILSGGECKENCNDLFELHPWLRVKLCLDKGIWLDERPEFVRAALSFCDDVPQARLVKGSQISSRLMSFHGADALVMLPARGEIENAHIVDGYQAKAILLN